MSEFTIKIDKEIKIRVLSDTTIEIDIDGHKAKAVTEDMAAIIRTCLPGNRGDEYFSEVEEKQVSKGKVMVRLKANSDMRQGDTFDVAFDITRYMENVNLQRKKESPLLLPYSGVRTNNSGFIY